jgi:putative transposase
LVEIKDNWPHAPPHRTIQPGTYMVTGATYQKFPFFKGSQRLSILQSALLELLPEHGWEVQAWAIFPNHYHFIAVNKENSANLKSLISQFHCITAKKINQMDEEPARKVWFQYWDTFLSYPASFFARLKYVHQNAVHHKIVQQAEDYPWCSASWFKTEAPQSFQKTIDRFKIDSLPMKDEF